MSKEGIEAKESHIAEEPPASIEVLDAEIDRAIADEQEMQQLSTEQDTLAAAEEQQLADVRGRLGLPSRRDMLRSFGALAVAGVAASPEVARAASERGERNWSPEQVRAYRQGLDELRASAAFDQDEQMRFFVARPDGTSEWRVPDNIQTVRFETVASRGATMTFDPKILDEINAEFRQGSEIRDVHTHPTRLFLGNPEAQSPIEGADRVPPSPLDIIGSVHQAERDGRAASRRSYDTVGAAGVWHYRPVSAEAATRLRDAFDAGTPTLTMLQGRRYTQHGRELAAYLRIKEQETTEHGSVALLYATLAEQIESGNLPKLLMESPGVIQGVSNMSEMLRSDQSMPRRARLYLRAIDRASAEVTAALRRIAPGTDGYIGDLPLIQNTDSYVERWRSLGIEMEFEPFDTELAAHVNTEARLEESGQIRRGMD